MIYQPLKQSNVQSSRKGTVYIEIVMSSDWFPHAFLYSIVFENVHAWYNWHALGEGDLGHNIIIKCDF